MATVLYTFPYACLGHERWPQGVFLKFTYGDQLGPITFLLVDAVEPMECTDVNVEMISPANNGIYQAQWRMCTNMGQYFGGTFVDSKSYLFLCTHQYIVECKFLALFLLFFPRKREILLILEQDFLL